MSTDADIQEVASCISMMAPDEILMESWIGALNSGEFKFGYGVLRSGEDEYDPLGVLAALGCPEWTWNEDEGAWEINGNAYDIPADQVASWLGVPADSGLRTAMKEVIERFSGVIVKASDGAKSHADIAKLLTAGIQRAAEQARRLREQRDRSVMSLRDAGRERPYYSDHIRAPYDDDILGYRR